MSKIQKLRGKGSFFRALIISYLIILIIPIFISVFSYFESLRIINTEVNNFREMVLTQFQQNIDSALSEIEDIADYIIWNPEIKWIANSAGQTGRSSAGDTLDIINRLKSLSNTSSLIKRIYILGRMINSSENNSMFNFPDDYIGKHFNWEDLPFDSNDEYITDASDTDNIVFLRKIPIISPSIESAYTAVFIDRKKLEQRLLSMEWLSRGGGIIYDSSSNPIVSSFDKLPGNEIIKSDYIESVRISDVNGWRYVSVLSKSFLYRKVIYLRLVIIVSVFLCAVSGLLAAWLLAVRNYNPVDSIIKKIRGGGSSYSDGQDLEESSELPSVDKSRSGINSSDEFSFIENSINEILTINRDMSEKLEMQKDLLKKRFLSRLISGRNLHSSETVMESCTYYNIDAELNKYLVIIFHIEDLSEKMYMHQNKDAAPGDADGESEDSSLLNLKNNLSTSDLSSELAWTYYQETVENESAAVFSDSAFSTWFTEIDGQIVELIGYDESLNKKNNTDEIIYREVSRFAENLMVKLEKSSLPLITTAVSRIHDNISAVSLAYNESLEAVEYELLMGRGNIIFYKNLPESETSVGSFTPIIDIQIRVINSIRSGDFKAARNHLTGFTDKMMAEKIDISIVKSRMSSLASTVLDILNIMSFQDNNAAEKQGEIITRLLKCSNLPDLQNFLDYLFDFFESSIQYDKSERKADNIVSSAAEYIIANYNDKNLSGGQIAENLDVSIQYLSMIFKKNRGTGLLDFIHKTRIDEGKKHLKENKLTVKDIADEIGYYNDLAFIRAFKRYEGTTPGKYREFNL